MPGASRPVTVALEAAEAFERRRLLARSLLELLYKAFGVFGPELHTKAGAGDRGVVVLAVDEARAHRRSEEHTSELQSLMRISYAVFCLKKKNTKETQVNEHTK